MCAQLNGVIMKSDKSTEHIPNKGFVEFFSAFGGSVIGVFMSSVPLMVWPDGKIVNMIWGQDGWVGTALVIFTIALPGIFVCHFATKRYVAKVKNKRKQQGLCPCCGYPISDLHFKCPECGINE